MAIASTGWPSTVNEQRTVCPTMAWRSVGHITCWASMLCFCSWSMIVLATLSLATTSEQAAVRKTSPTALDARNRPNPERVIIGGSSWFVRTVRPSRDETVPLRATGRRDARRTTVCAVTRTRSTPRPAAMRNAKQGLAELSRPGPLAVLRGDLGMSGIPGVDLRARGGARAARGRVRPRLAAARRPATPTCCATSPRGVSSTAAPSSHRGPLPSHAGFAADLRTALEVCVGVRLGEGRISVDSRRTAFAGHGIGGGAALVAAAGFDRVAAVVTLARRADPPVRAGGGAAAHGAGAAPGGGARTWWPRPPGTPSRSPLSAGGPVILRTLPKASHTGFLDGRHWSDVLLSGGPNAKVRELTRALVTAFLHAPPVRRGPGRPAGRRQDPGHRALTPPRTAEPPPPGAHGASLPVATPSSSVVRPRDRTPRRSSARRARDAAARAAGGRGDFRQSGPRRGVRGRPIGACICDPTGCAPTPPRPPTWPTRWRRLGRAPGPAAEPVDTAVTRARRELAEVRARCAPRPPRRRPPITRRRTPVAAGRRPVVTAADPARQWCVEAVGLLHDTALRAARLASAVAMRLARRRRASVGRADRRAAPRPRRGRSGGRRPRPAATGDAIRRWRARWPPRYGRRPRGATGRGSATRPARGSTTPTACASLSCPSRLA